MISSAPVAVGAARVGTGRPERGAPGAAGRPGAVVKESPQAAKSADLDHHDRCSAVHDRRDP